MNLSISDFQAIMFRHERMMMSSSFFIYSSFYNSTNLRWEPLFEKNKFNFDVSHSPNSNPKFIMLIDQPEIAPFNINISAEMVIYSPLHMNYNPLGSYTTEVMANVEERSRYTKARRGELH